MAGIWLVGTVPDPIRAQQGEPGGQRSGPVAKPAASPIPLAEWSEPPRDARPTARWWWPGGSVEPGKVRRQLEAIRRAGFGAVELQPLLLGLGEADMLADPGLRTVGEPEFFARVADAAAAAKALGLGFDLTLGSGWPGGLPTSPANAERQLLMASVEVQGPMDFKDALPAPPGQSYRDAVEWVLDVLGPPDREIRRVAVLAGRVEAGPGGVPTLSDVRELSDRVAGGILSWAVPPGSWRVFALYANSTSHFVMGGAFPGREEDARVVDHLSRSGADALLDGYGTPAMAALNGQPVRGLFVDSFELMGELPFTSGFPAAFEAYAGYDLIPELPLVFRRGGESKYAEMIDFLGRGGGPLYRAPAGEGAERGVRIREDYEAVRSQLFQDEFVARLAEWARARDLEFRLQAHGGYGDYLDTYALADVPEAEGLFADGGFDFLKLASSAAHVGGRPWASSESFITLQVLGTRLGGDEMQLLAGRAYAAGINRVVHHGVPYAYTRADGETWFPFSGGFGRILAGPFPMSSEIDGAFLRELPEFNGFLARLSVAMSQGVSVAEVAWLRVDRAYPDAASIQLGRVEVGSGESETTQILRARGLGYDRVSRRMLAGAQLEGDGFRVGAGHYRALILDPLEVAEPALIARVSELAAAGIPVIALGELPRRAPGLRDAAARDHAVKAASKAAKVKVVGPVRGEALEAVLASRVRPGFVEPVAGEALAFSLARRWTSRGEIVLFFNEAWSPGSARLRFTRGGGALWRWDPITGSRSRLRARVEAGDEILLELEAAGVALLTLDVAVDGGNGRELGPGGSGAQQEKSEAPGED
ncbi:MAG: glycosyl hydrolase [Myxococcota bacterium]|nr:glycosyl hydrolase [Myxococcota bacterium]